MDSRDDATDIPVGVGNASMLIITSVLLLHVAIHDGSPSPWIEWTALFLSVLLVMGASIFFRKTGSERTASLPKRHRELTKSTGTLVVPPFRSRSMVLSPSIGEVIFLLLFCSLPFITDIVLRRVVYHGNPLEIQVTFAIRNLMLGLIMLPTKATGRLAVMTSYFLAIYGAIVSVSATTYGLLAAYALFGLWWLMGDYWQRISVRFPNESIVEIPYVARVSAVALVLLCLGGGALTIQADAVTSAVAGFLPSSGGAGGNDPFARGGVGDGDQLVGATDDANSFGPIESDLFLESQQPTLYDMFIDTYETAAPKKRESQTRAIPLSAEENQKQNHTKFAQNKKSSREFSAIRRETKGRKRKLIDDTESNALLFVAGRTPLHLGLAIFDHWDGRTLSLQSKTEAPKLRLETDASQRKWATWTDTNSSECFGSPERHLLKIINLNSPTIPTPPNQTAVHIDKLHAAGFFRWENGLLRLLGKKIPSLTVIHVRSQRLRRDRLDHLVLRKTDSENIVAPRLNELASDWCAGAKSDWERVESICRQLREYDLDTKSLVPEETPDAVQHFLFESRRGPDFLFATSAAVLVRALGYDTRVVSGLYAHPENYDRMAKSTGVLASDVHFWLEVKTEDGLWIPAEPTPGFEVLYAQQTPFQAAALAVSKLAEQVGAHPIAHSIAIFALIGSFVCRQRLFMLAATAWWQLRLSATPRQQVLRSVRLLKQLTSRKSSCHRAGQTIDQWLAALGQRCHDSSSIVEFRSLVSWACYASSDQPAFAPGAVRQICVESVKLLKNRV